MNYKKAGNFLNSNIKEDFDITKVVFFNDDMVKNLINELKIKKEITSKICDAKNSYNEKILLDLYNLDVNYNKKLINEISDCKKRYKIIYILIESKLNNVKHINILLIDNKKKIVERFDTIGDSMKKINKITQLLINRLKLNYKIKFPSKFIFNETRRDCRICVPLSLLYIYIRIRYDLNLDDVIKLFTNYNNKELFSISIWFIEYLNNVRV